jgi:hypothetical protein
MNNEDHHAHRTCRIFVLVIIGTIVIAFLMVVFLFHPALVGRPKLYRRSSAATPPVGLMITHSVKE